MRGLSFVLLLAACGGQDIWYVPPATTNAAFDTPAKIFAHLDGKTLLMEGANIPSHPNGYSAQVNFGQATQCYQRVMMTASARRITVVSRLGTLVGAPRTGDTGTCDPTSLSNELSFDSTAVLIENVREGCFDFTITYPGFGQEGRGALAADGQRLTLELYFKDQATGHRCGDGEVGGATVTLRQNAFMGDAKQIYEVRE